MVLDPQKNKVTVGVLGCGWLGLALAKKLLDYGYVVRGSRRSQQGVNLLNNNGVEGYELLLDDTEVCGQIHFFNALDVLCICLPPGVRKNPNSDFVKKIVTLLPHLNKAQIKHILFTSSISVYGTLTGVVDENSQPVPQSRSAKQIWAVEKLLSKNFPKTLTVARLGGLIGDKRHPIYKLIKKINNPQGNTPINLIHRKDAVNALIHFIQKPFQKPVFNLVSPYHPSKQFYYCQIAKQWGVNIPQFTISQEKGKLISSQLLTEQYDFQFEVEKLLIE